MIFGVRTRDGRFAHYRYDRAEGVVLKAYPQGYDDLYDAQVALRLCPNDWGAEIVTVRYSWSTIQDGSVRIVD